MATGTVKWFNNAKGYGFVLSEDSGEDLFIHYSSIQMDGYKSLKAGQEVLYDVQQGPKGMHAVNIRASANPVGEDQPIEDREDNLHLNPMRSLPTSSPAVFNSGTASETRTETQAEVALE